MLKFLRFYALGAVFCGVSMAHAADIQLWDNGPFVTHLGAGFGGADASSIQLGNIFGVGHQATQNNKVADDFEIPANTKMRIKELRFFSYQNNSGTTPTINSITLQVWSGIPGGGGTVIYDSSATNRLTSATFANAYRVSPAALTAVTRPVMECVCTIPGGLVLDGGPTGATYWLSWQSSGTLASGPWAMMVTTLGQTGKPGANARQFVGQTSLWSEVLDAGAPPGYPVPVPQDLCFKMLGRQTEKRGAASYTVTSGFEIAGDLASLQTSDDNGLIVFPDDQTLIATVEVTSAPTNNVGSTDITVTCEQSVGRPGLTVQGALRNQATNNFDVQFGGVASTTDVTNIVLSSNPDYISNAGEIVLRVSWAPINDEDPAQDGWTHSVDFVSYEVGP